MIESIPAGHWPRDVRAVPLLLRLGMVDRAEYRFGEEATYEAGGACVNDTQGSSAVDAADWL